MILELLDAVLRGIGGTDVAELEYEMKGCRVKVIRNIERLTSAQQVSKNQPAAIEPPASSTVAAADMVRATLHGTFYRTLAPDQPPFVEPGQLVEAGQQVGVVEAMKMLHAIESDFAGRLVEVLVENGAHVEPGTALFIIERSSGDV